MQTLMPPERIPPSPRRDAYIALLKQLGITCTTGETDADATGESVSATNPPANPERDADTTPDDAD